MYLIYCRSAIQNVNMKFVLILLGLIPFTVIAQKDNTGGFTINGKVNGLPENSVVYLAGSSEKDTIAKATVQHNAFVLKGKFANGDGAMLMFPATDKRMFLFIGNETVNITASNSS